MAYLSRSPSLAHYKTYQGEHHVPLALLLHFSSQTFFKAWLYIMYLRCLVSDLAEFIAMVHRLRWSLSLVRLTADPPNTRLALGHCDASSCCRWPCRLMSPSLISLATEARSSSKDLRACHCLCIDVFYPFHCPRIIEGLSNIDISSHRRCACLSGDLPASYFGELFFLHVRWATDVLQFWPSDLDPIVEPDNLNKGYHQIRICHLSCVFLFLDFWTQKHINF
jgi:hypothetical protein